MNASRVVRRSLLGLGFAVAISSALAQAQTAQEFKPTVGQPGKDVVWVPTPQPLVDKMLDMAGVTPQDFVIDLGSGDGRTVITAAKRGARALGIEYNPEMVELSRRSAASQKVTERAQFVRADLFESDVTKASVITMFLLPDIMVRLRPKLLELRPGTRLVSNTFDMDDWAADETATVSDGCTSWCTALLWIVPAKVAGTWRLPQGELRLTQQYQMIEGTLQAGGATTPITAGRLRGDQISFTVGTAQYTGRVNGNIVEGTVVAGGNTSKWSATRADG